MGVLRLLRFGERRAESLGSIISMAAGSPGRRRERCQPPAVQAAWPCPPVQGPLGGLGCGWPRAGVMGTSPGHELVQFLLVLLVLSGNGVLSLLLHCLHEVLHVLEGIDLRQRHREPLNMRSNLTRKKLLLVGQDARSTHPQMKRPSTQLRTPQDRGPGHGAGRGLCFS